MGFSILCFPVWNSIQSIRAFRAVTPRFILPAVSFLTAKLESSIPGHTVVSVLETVTMIRRNALEVLLEPRRARFICVRDWDLASLSDPRAPRWSLPLRHRQSRDSAEGCIPKPEAFRGLAEFLRHIQTEALPESEMGPHLWAGRPVSVPLLRLCPV